MSRINKKMTALVFAMAWFMVFCSCAPTNSLLTEDPKTEIWEMKFTGDSVATYRMLLNRNRIEQDTYAIKGEFSGITDDHIGGRGMVKCTCQGKIIRNSLHAEFSGKAYTPINVNLLGSLQGTLSATAGTGKYSFSHEQGASKGAWTLKKISTGK